MSLFPPSFLKNSFSYLEFSVSSFVFFNHLKNIVPLFLASIVSDRNLLSFKLVFFYRNNSYPFPPAPSPILSLLFPLHHLYENEILLYSQTWEKLTGEWSCKWILQPQSSLQMTIDSRQLDCSLMKDPEPDPPR